MEKCHMTKMFELITHSIENHTVADTLIYYANDANTATNGIRKICGKRKKLNPKILALQVILWSRS